VIAALPAPRLRGVLHAYALVPALALCVVLVVLAPAALPRVSAALYGAGLCVCLGVSALYHRGRWSERIKATLGRVDHSTIFLLIAGTATPVFLLSVRGALGVTLFVIEWAGAACGMAIALLWQRPPVWAEVGPYLVLGWFGLMALPALLVSTGPTGIALLIGGGALYTVGAVCYAFELPNPWPTTFGFHEIFHSFVIAAAAAHAVLISVLVFTS
jgi:hemolysin III